MRSFAACLLAVLTPALAAQEMEPRAYSASPVGTSFLVVPVLNSAGAVVTDPTIPLTDVSANVVTFAPRYGHSFGLFGAQALFTASLPYAWAWVSGKVQSASTDSAITRDGMADLMAKLTVNFVGSPAMTPAQFAKRTVPAWLVGASLAITAPTGEYFPYKLVNIGSDRWSFKPEVGVSYNWRARLYVDLYSGVTFFSPNPAFYPGTSTRTQDPLWSVQLHASYNFTPRIFAALESTWYSGGSSIVNGGPPSARQDNSRVGALFSYGFTSRQAVKISYSAGAVARAGQNFKTWMLAYQYLWF
jgi:hypothetical protein